MASSTSIPTGAWSLWYHSPKETKWTTATYIHIATIRTWEEFWTLVDLIGDDTFLNGFFFFMKDPTPPRWENKANIRGGTYSMRLSRKDAFDNFIKYTVSAMVDMASHNPANKINGVTISPKRGFNIINIWNEDFTYSALEDLREYTRRLPGEEVRYTRHIDKKFN
jgi:hypothetical protein